MTPFDPAPALDLYQQLGSDPAIFAPLMEGMRAEADNRRAGLRAAIDHDDAKAMADHAHALKSSAGQFGLLALQDITARMDMAGKRGDDATVRTLAPTVVPAMEEAMIHLEQWWATVKSTR